MEGGYACEVVRSGGVKVVYGERCGFVRCVKSGGTCEVRSVWREWRCAWVQCMCEVYEEWRCGCEVCEEWTCGVRCVRSGGVGVRC